MQSFATPRLLLRPIDAADEALYVHLYTDPGVMRHIAAPLSADAAQRGFRAACRLAALPAPLTRLWIVSECGMPGRLGVLALLQHKDDPDGAEPGVMLTAAAQGVGVASEALAGLAEHAFATLQLQRLSTRHAAGNVAVARMMVKLGYQRADAGGTEPAEWRWQMTRGHWQSRRGAQAPVAQAPAGR